MMRRVPGLWLAILLIGLTLAACADDERVSAPSPTATLDVRPRTFVMGLSSLPAELTEESYADAFELAGSSGEVILIQRTPPWAEMLSGRLSEETVQSTQREKDLSANYGLDLFVAIDPADIVDGRSQLADLPTELRGAGFGNDDVRRAFIAYAQYVAENYRPTYLALGVEINSYQQQHPEDFERFVVLYHQAYDAVKELSPETLVFPTFQLEELQGLLPVDDPLPPQWHLISRFEPRLDLLAVSTFPSLAFADADLIPESYYARLVSYTHRPVAITGMGYSSEAGPDGAGEGEQADFLRRVLDTAQQLSMPLVVWFVGQDPTFSGETTFDQLRHSGLRRQDGSVKEAWRVWEAAARRPLAQAPASGAASR